MSEPDKRPTPSRGMPAIRVAVSDMMGDHRDLSKLRFITTELVYLQEQAETTQLLQSGQIATLEQKVEQHGHAIESNTASIARHEREQKKSARAVAGLRRSFAQNIMRMRRMEKGQKQLLAAVRSPAVMRQVAFGVACGTIIFHALSWVWNVIK